MRSGAGGRAGTGRVGGRLAVPDLWGPSDRLPRGRPLPGIGAARRRETSSPPAASPAASRTTDTVRSGASRRNDDVIGTARGAGAPAATGGSGEVLLLVQVS